MDRGAWWATAHAESDTTGQLSTHRHTRGKHGEQNPESSKAGTEPLAARLLQLLREGFHRPPASESLLAHW